MAHNRPPKKRQKKLDAAPSTAEVVDTSHQKVYIVLERACLETIKTKKGYQLLNCDEHMPLLRKMKRDPQNVRPDIVHQALMTLLDSPLNKTGHLQIYVHTTKNVLIEISPHIRIPRTFRRFCGLMVQLLHKMKIRAVGASTTLLKVVKNPVTQYLPTGCRKIGTSVKGELVDAIDFVPTLPKQPVAFVFGSHASGPVIVDYTEEDIALSQYPLSAATALARLVHAFEHMWKIL